MKSFLLGRPVLCNSNKSSRAGNHSPLKTPARKQLPNEYRTTERQVPLVARYQCNSVALITNRDGGREFGQPHEYTG